MWGRLVRTYQTTWLQAWVYNQYCNVRKWKVSKRKASVELLVHISVVRDSESASTWCLSASSTFAFMHHSNITLLRCFRDSIVYSSSPYSISFQNSSPTIHIGLKSCTVNLTINYPESLFALFYTFACSILIQFSFVLKNEQFQECPWYYKSFVGGHTSL